MGFGSFVGGFAGQINKEREQDRLLEIEEEKARIASERSFANSKKLMEVTEALKNRYAIEAAEREVAIERRKYLDFIGQPAADRKAIEDASAVINNVEKLNKVSQPGNVPSSQTGSVPSSQTGSVPSSQPGAKNIINSSVEPEINNTDANNIFKKLQTNYRQKFYTPEPDRSNYWTGNSITSLQAYKTALLEYQKNERAKQTFEETVLDRYGMSGLTLVYANGYPDMDKFESAEKDYLGVLKNYGSIYAEQMKREGLNEKEFVDKYGDNILTIEERILKEQQKEALRPPSQPFLPGMGEGESFGKSSVFGNINDYVQKNLPPVVVRDDEQVLDSITNMPTSNIRSKQANNAIGLVANSLVMMEQLTNSGTTLETAFNDVSSELVELTSSIQQHLNKQSEDLTSGAKLNTYVETKNTNDPKLQNLYQLASRAVRDNNSYQNFLGGVSQLMSPNDFKVFKQTVKLNKAEELLSRMDNGDTNGAINSFTADVEKNDFYTSSEKKYIIDTLRKKLVAESNLAFSSELPGMSEAEKRMSPIPREVMPGAVTPGAVTPGAVTPEIPPEEPESGLPGARGGSLDKLFAGSIQRRKTRDAATDAAEVEIEEEEKLEEQASGLPDPTNPLENMLMSANKQITTDIADIRDSQIPKDYQNKEVPVGTTRSGYSLIKEAYDKGSSSIRENYNRGNIKRIADNILRLGNLDPESVAALPPEYKAIYNDTIKFATEKEEEEDKPSRRFEQTGDFPAPKYKPEGSEIWQEMIRQPDDTAEVATKEEEDKPSGSFEQTRDFPAPEYKPGGSELWQKMIGQTVDDLEQEGEKPEVIKREVEETLGDFFDISDGIRFANIWSDLYQTDNDLKKYANYIFNVARFSAMDAPEEEAIEKESMAAAKAFIKDFKKVDPSLDLDRVATLLKHTAYHESEGGKYDEQQNGGPARGWWQVEPSTARDLISLTSPDGNRKAILIGPLAEGVMGYTAEELREMNDEEFSEILKIPRVNAIFAASKYATAMLDKQQRMS